MGHVIWSTTGVVVFLVVISALVECRTIVKRESEIDPHDLQEFTDANINRDKRKVEVVTGVKNAVLGFVFNKINSFIDHKTAWVDQLDKTNIAKNEAHHIYPPADPVLSLSGIISGAIGQKLQAAGPLLHIVTSKLSGASSGASHKGLNFGGFVGGGAGPAHGAAI